MNLYHGNISHKKNTLLKREGADLVAGERNDLFLLFQKNDIPQEPTP